MIDPTGMDAVVAILVFLGSFVALFWICTSLRK